MFEVTISEEKNLSDDNSTALEVDNEAGPSSSYSNADLISHLDNHSDEGQAFLPSSGAGMFTILSTCSNTANI